MVVAFVPCKGESVRVPRKNASFVGGMPLWLRKCEQLSRIESIDEVWVDTDCAAIASDAERRGYRVMRREDAVNGYDGHQLFAWEVSQVPHADVYVQALCTAPFLSDGSIDRCIQKARSFDTACIACERRDYVLRHYDPIPPSNVLGGVRVDCMSLYAVDGDYARRYGKRTSGDIPSHVLVDESEAIDIDYPADLQLAQEIALGRHAVERRWLRGMEPVLSSALIADCLEEHGVRQCTTEFEYCAPTRAFGRACCLELCLADEADRSIYDALEHYDWCMPGDVLCVSTGAVYAAYFGELNSLLAYRAGASGVLVEHATRDSGSTVVPVWSDYRMPSDCRDVLGVRQVGGSIEMHGMFIDHGDLIYADCDGVARIPRSVESEVLALAMKRAECESAIKLGIAGGASVRDIVKSNKNF